MQTAGISVLMADTGERARAIQHWSDLGILHAQADTDRKGRGRYREYAVEPYFGERKWALIASALNKLRIPLGDMRSIVDVMRQHGGPVLNDTGISKRSAINKFEVSFFYQSLIGNGDVLCLIAIAESKMRIRLCFTPAIRAEILSPPRNVEFDPSAEFILRMIHEFVAEHESSYCLNLTKVFAPLRG